MTHEERLHRLRSCLMLVLDFVPDEELSDDALVVAIALRVGAADALPGQRNNIPSRDDVTHLAGVVSDAIAVSTSAGQRQTGRQALHAMVGLLSHAQERVAALAAVGNMAIVRLSELPKRKNA